MCVCMCGCVSLKKRQAKKQASQPPIYSYPYQINTVLIGPSHHGTRTIVQPCWPLSLSPVSSSTWLSVWAPQKAWLSAFNAVTYKEDKIINFINFLLRVADQCGHESPGSSSSPLLFWAAEMPAGLSSLKGRENKSGAVVGEQEECENTTRWSKYKCRARRNRSPVSPCAALRGEKNRDGSFAFSSGCAVCSHNRCIYFLLKKKKPLWIIATKHSVELT